eukprot:GDKJ01006495.1.p1 GENE.GDKJ01006495.1~~GDKJ01006495.1.p1  ORF type:complete len:498 (-),score=107.12 GDKJ01006495.1:371-1864(-)
MAAVGFDNNLYIKLQSEAIRKRISQFGGKLYLEFGGKLFDDLHASRVLPGFQPDSKLQMLLKLKSEAEIVIAINAADIKSSKVRGDLGISYDSEVLRLIDSFRGVGMFVGSVVITNYKNQPSADAFRAYLETLSVKTFLHYPIDGYPANLELIVSDNGYGKNQYITTERSLIVVTAPGPGSGKMATALSQLYHEHKRGISAGYAKFETFPIWNLPLMHPVNLAYEAATADLADVNMIDPFHLEAYGETTVNYNRDIEVFPVLTAIFEKITHNNKSPYRSPTDMGVNMAGKCIINDEICRCAAKQEIIRRYYGALCQQKQGRVTSTTAQKIEVLMKKTSMSIANDRPIVAVANQLELRTSAPAASMALHDGTIVTGKTTPLMGCTSALLLNALKVLAGINAELDLLAPSVIEPIQKLKTGYLGNKNPRLHIDEILIALTICSTTNPVAQLALNQLQKLKGCEMHCSVMLSNADSSSFNKLGIHLTCEPKYETDRVYQK